MITLLFLLFLKHFIFDFLLQPKWMWANKGKFGHIGGVAHAALHGIATYIILHFLKYPAFGFALLESGLHYHIDWAKMNISKHFNLTPTSSEKWFYILGLDQFLHSLCYLAIAYFII